jgi:hypothetical protein
VIPENYYLRMAAEYEMKAGEASNFIEKCALQDVAQAYHDVALYAVSKNARGRDDDADVQALAERMVANGHQDQGF